MFRPRARNPGRGFTLIELLIVIGLFAVFATFISTASFASNQADTRSGLTIFTAAPNINGTPGAAVLANATIMNTGEEINMAQNAGGTYEAVIGTDITQRITANYLEKAILATAGANKTFTNEKAQLVATIYVIDYTFMTTTAQARAAPGTEIIGTEVDYLVQARAPTSAGTFGDVYAFEVEAGTLIVARSRDRPNLSAAAGSPVYE